MKTVLSIANIWYYSVRTLIELTLIWIYIWDLKIYNNVRPLDHIVNRKKHWTED